MSHVFLQARTTPQRRDCQAEVVGLELRNVVAKYPFESSHRFPGIKPNSGHRDYSRLSSGVGETQLGPSARISAGVLTRTLVAARLSLCTFSKAHTLIWRTRSRETPTPAALQDNVRSFWDIQSMGRPHSALR